MSPRSSASASPRRRPLHERTPSQTNEGSPARVGKRRDEIDFYTTSPYPTKPAQVFLPHPGIGQDYAHPGAYGVSSLSLVSTETDHTATGPIGGHRDTDASISNNWDFSSSIDLGHSSQVWDNDPQSSQSSFPTPLLPSDDTNADDDSDFYEDKTVSKHGIYESEMQQNHESTVSDEDDALGDGEEDDANEDDVIVLPPQPRASIKSVLPGNSSPRNEPGEDFSSSDSENFVTYDHTSSPNVVPIGAPSSPNFVSYGSSSPNLIALGSTSPATGGLNNRSDSTASSSNSLGTVIHHTYNNATGWPGLLSDGVSSQPASFNSSPPEQLLRGYQSASSLALSGGEASLSRSRTTSTGSGRSEVEIADPAIAVIQYPQVRAPSYASSFAESSAQLSQVRRPARAMSEKSAARWNPTLSTVPAQSVAAIPSTAGSTLADIERKQGLGLMTVSKSSSTIWPVEENDERFDSLSNLPRSTLRHIPSSLIGSSESRPGSSSSNNGFLNMLPNWVRLYYHSNGQLVQGAALSIFDPSRPSTAASRPVTPHRYVSQNSVNLSRPRTRPCEEKAVQAPRLIADHPADPRSHWKPTKKEQDEAADAESSARRPVAKVSSPHLHPDKGHPNPRYTWTAPSVDSRLEPMLGRRNIQKYAFCLGFLFPLAWFIAAFLPLPPPPTLDEELVVAQPGAEYRIEEYERKRYQSARWWRNVNRVMVPVGTAIIAIIVTMAVVGTTVGF